jgi:hypothetical protein
VREAIISCLYGDHVGPPPLDHLRSLNCIRTDIYSEFSRRPEIEHDIISAVALDLEITRICTFQDQIDEAGGALSTARNIGITCNKAPASPDSALLMARGIRWLSDKSARSLALSQLNIGSGLDVGATDSLLH